MNGIIAVEKTLSTIAEALEGEGYDVVPLEEGKLDEVDAIVVSGMDVNLLNMQDVMAEVPVINASGKSVNEILEEIETL